MRNKGALLARSLLVMVLGTTAFAYPSFGAPDNRFCLECHGERAIGEKGGQRLYIDPVRFAETSHKLVRCAACHVSVTDQHPLDGVKPSRATCKECHGPVAQEYAKSLHGENATCADCHNPHQARKLAYVSGVEINAVCARCHLLADTVGNHEKWLPQAGHHLDQLPCITCHTGSQNYFIDLFIEQQSVDGSFRLATYGELVRFADERGVSSGFDTNDDHFISLQELRKANIKGRTLGMRLRGLMMPEVMTHSYQTLDNRRDCTFCHVSGTKNTQSSFLSLPTATGTYKRLPVEKGAVLDILYGTPDFYMTGATRSKALSIIGAVIVVCGLIMPIGHGLVRYLTRQKREHDIRHTAKVVIVYLHSTPIRIWHWIHAVSIVTLCLSGMQIRFPDVFTLFGGYKSAVYLHNTAGIVLTVSMVFWVLYYVVIAHSIGRIYFPSGEDLKHGLVRQVIFYFFNYFRGKPNPFHATPENKFNALQKIAYLVIMFVFMPLVIVTGILLLDVELLRNVLSVTGGVKLVDGLHFLTASCLCAFLFTHFYLTTLGPTPFWEIRTMWKGWEEEVEKGGKVPAAPQNP